MARPVQSWHSDLLVPRATFLISMVTCCQKARYDSWKRLSAPGQTWLFRETQRGPHAKPLVSWSGEQFQCKFVKLLKAVDLKRRKISTLRAHAVGPRTVPADITRMPDFFFFCQWGLCGKKLDNFRRGIFQKWYGADEKKLICTNSVALRKRWAIYKRVKTPFSAACLTFVRRPQNAFRKSPTSMFWPSTGLFSSADQFLMLPSCQHTLLVSGCPKNAHLDAAGGHSAGLRSLNHPACYAPEGASSTCCLFLTAGEATWAFFLLWNVMPSSLKASVLVTVEIPHAVEI